MKNAKNILKRYNELENEPKNDPDDEFYKGYPEVLKKLVIKINLKGVGQREWLLSRVIDELVDIAVNSPSGEAKIKKAVKKIKGEI